MLNLFLIIILVFSLFVISSKNMVQSIFFLILVFLSSSLLFISMGAEFIGLIILIVYIGAIAVSFLYVIMMLNIRFAELNTKRSMHNILIIILSILFIISIFFLYHKNYGIVEVNNSLEYLNIYVYRDFNIKGIGELLLNECFLSLPRATFLLLVAMIGSIILTTSINDVSFDFDRRHTQIIYWSFK